ncbi:uncharacterized protein LOC114947454 [Acropora millepora]|uniref:uncharacterized protein LOC114947454 n=1 Tax=Acropora millepora TaxID=45264 RepID=UPI001CF22956|nr:uncharacterized protein LOC114947454 [Acropora millepora]
MEESVVKEFLIEAGYNQEAGRKYKTLHAWEHKEGIHSFKIHLLANHKDIWVIGSCNPSFSTDNEESKAMYLVLETSTNNPVYSYCTCTVGLRGDCSHIGALMFVLSDIVAEGKHAAIAIRSNVHQIQHALICDVLGQTLKVQKLNQYINFYKVWQGASL